ncbi:MAG: lytic transglycosylase domain-containing protein [Candidatus Sericytochromatia bacterium]|nr:lytic transglycosylase domain-containing protein [Candidatus Tanganyikabacteria bacterium]
MSLEPSGLDQILSRIREIEARFVPPPVPPRPPEAGTEAGPTRLSYAPGDAGPDQIDPGEASTQSYDFAAALAKAAGKSGMDPKLLAAVVRVESGGDPRSRSHKGAMGLMQLMPETARDYGVRNPYDPVDNMTGGGKYLKRMIGKFGGDLSLGLAAYNAGENAVSRHKGVPPYRETQAFVRRVLDIYQGNQP